MLRGKGAVRGRLGSLLSHSSYGGGIPHHSYGKPRTPVTSTPPAELQNSQTLRMPISPWTSMRNYVVFHSPRRKRKKTQWKVFTYGLGISSAVTLGGLGALWYSAVGYYPQLRDLTWQETSSHLIRFMRTALVGFATTVDYKYALFGLEEETQEYRAARSLAHQRTANRLLKLCRKNAGVYIKAGQHIASMNHVLPQEYITTLSVLQDRAPHRPFHEVIQQFERELGGHLSQFFKEFSEVPLAAASLAQVHRAVTLDGTEVAVKVQHRDFEKLCYGDLYAITVAIKAIAWFFPYFQFAWVVPEFEKNLTMEMDFENEGKNAERLARNFESNGQVGVPKIIWPLTRRRILCMEFVKGVKINDVDGLKELGVNTQKVAALLHELFCEQIFVHGFIHSDPHPGNLLVQKRPDGKPKIIVLDHGLYRELTPQFRKDYCNLWKAIVLRDKPKIELYCRKMGAGDYHQLFAVVLTFRPMDDKAGVALVDDSKMSTTQLKLMRDQLRGQNFREKISELLENLDRQLLLVLRTNNLIRSIIKDLGAYSSVDRFLVMARYSVRGLNTDMHDGKAGWGSGWQSYCDLLLFDARLKMYGVILWLWQTWLGISNRMSNFFAMHADPKYL